MKIRCVTLFDITKTDLSGRRKHLSDAVPPELAKQRNQQSNWETIVQVISLRCQPENITDPVCGVNNGIKWGKLYGVKTTKSWEFTFTVAQSAIFVNDGDTLGNLKMDCTGVPMVVGLDEDAGLIKTLDIDPDNKNIHFEVVNG